MKFSLRYFDYTGINIPMPVYGHHNKEVYEQESYKHLVMDPRAGDHHQNTAL